MEVAADAPVAVAVAQKCGSLFASVLVLVISFLFLTLVSGKR
jgi:hypothetical protein